MSEDPTIDETDHMNSEQSFEDETKELSDRSREKISGDVATFDVWSNDKYPWTTQNDVNIKMCPWIKLIEYQNFTDVRAIQTAMAIEQARNTLNMAVEGVQGETDSLKSQTFWELYGDFYAIFPTGNIYKFPYLSEDPFQITVNFKGVNSEDGGSWMANAGNAATELIGQGKSFYDNAMEIWNTGKAVVQSGSESKEGLMKRIEEALNGAGTYRKERAGITPTKQSVKMYDSANCGTFSCSFTLLNISPDAVKNNYTLIRTIYRNVAPSYPNINYVRSPALYDIYVPGVTRIPLGYIKTFNATPVGARTYQKGGIVTPNAWTIKMEFGSLFPISKQLIDVIDEDPSNSDANQFKWNRVENNSDTYDEYSFSNYSTER